VTQYILNSPQIFNIGNIENSEDLSKIRLTVDHKVDFDLVKTVIENFTEGEIFTMEKIVAFLNQNPKLKEMNSHIPFNEGFLKSLREDGFAEKGSEN